NNEIILAVYPFENLTAGDGLNVFCRSFQIDLITELSRFRQFTVINSPNDEAISARTDYTIKGSFHGDNDKLKISAQLTNSHNRHAAWADRFEGTKDAIFSLQENLLKKVVSTLQQQLNYDLLTRVRKKKRVHPTAYEPWLYGME